MSYQILTYRLITYQEQQNNSLVIKITQKSIFVLISNIIIGGPPFAAVTTSKKFPNCGKQDTSDTGFCVFVFFFIYK
jgi:hypothetical protein